MVVLVFKEFVEVIIVVIIVIQQKEKKRNTEEYQLPTSGKTSNGVVRVNYITRQWRLKLSQHEPVFMGAENCCRPTDPSC